MSYDPKDHTDGLSEAIERKITELNILILRAAEEGVKLTVDTRTNTVQGRKVPTVTLLGVKVWRLLGYGGKGE